MILAQVSLALSRASWPRRSMLRIAARFRLVVSETTTSVVPRHFVCDCSTPVQYLSGRNSHARERALPFCALLLSHPLSSAPALKKDRSILKLSVIRDNSTYLEPAVRGPATPAHDTMVLEVYVNYIPTLTRGICFSRTQTSAARRVLTWPSTDDARQQD